MTNQVFYNTSVYSFSPPPTHKKNELVFSNIKLYSIAVNNLAEELHPIHSTNIQRISLNLCNFFTELATSRKYSENL